MSVFCLKRLPFIWQAVQNGIGSSVQASSKKPVLAKPGKWLSHKQIRYLYQCPGCAWHVSIFGFITSVTFIISLLVSTTLFRNIPATTCNLYRLIQGAWPFRHSFREYLLCSGGGCLCFRIVLGMRNKNQNGNSGQHKEPNRVVLMNFFPYLPIHPPLQEKQPSNE